MRWLYWQFDKPASTESDLVVFANRRLQTLRQKIGILPKHRNYPVIGIGTDPIKILHKKRITPLCLVFFGVLKKFQGLDLFFDSAPELYKQCQNIRLIVIGGGPDEQYFKNRAQKCPFPVQFTGYIPNQNKVGAFLSRSHIGIAPYMSDESSVSYFTDPSKIKHYVSSGLPVITTGIIQFSKEIKKEKAGEIIPYKTKDFIRACIRIWRNYPFYQSNALRLAQKYYYKDIYASFFT